MTGFTKITECKIFILLLMLLMSETIVSQDNKGDAVYNQGRIYTSFFNDKGDLYTEIPMGKNVSVIYDSFYKSYLLEFDMENGISSIKLSYINEVAVGTRYNKKGIVVILVDAFLDKEGKLIFYEEKLRNQEGNLVQVAYRVENLKRVQ